MIVYPDVSRTKNYGECRLILPDLRRYNAIDTVSVELFDKQTTEGACEGELTQEYINSHKNMRGKVGCNLSHIRLWKELINDSNEWHLILEDDAAIQPSLAELCSNILTSLDDETKYVQLYCNPYFVNKQKQSPSHKGLYEMIPQWHTLAYLVSSSGLRVLLDSLPMGDNVDHCINELIPNLRAKTYVGHIVTNRGSLHGCDRSSDLGSLIFGIPSK